MKFFVVDKDKGPVKGVVISLTAPDGKYYTERDGRRGLRRGAGAGGQKYDVTYLSLGREDIAATVPVTNEPNQTVKLTLRYKRLLAPPPFVLTGVTFDTGKATIRPESFPRLDIVVEFMMHKKSARVEISGHTDNVGNPKSNKTLSEKRAQACRDYIVSKGIDGSGSTPSATATSAPSPPTTATRADRRTAASKPRSCSSGALVEHEIDARDHDAVGAGPGAGGLELERLSPSRSSARSSR